jgi:hypothetical protein
VGSPGEPLAGTTTRLPGALRLVRTVSFTVRRLGEKRLDGSARVASD